jgi:hypothetical protein
MESHCHITKTQQFEQKEKEPKEGLKAEAELLANLSRVGLNRLICSGLWLIQTQLHIIEYRHSQGWEIGKAIEIFMSVADGSLRDPLERVRQNQTQMKVDRRQRPILVYSAA